TFKSAAPKLIIEEGTVIVDSTHHGFTLKEAGCLYIKDGAGEVQFIGKSESDGTRKSVFPAKSTLTGNETFPRLFSDLPCKAQYVPYHKDGKEVFIPANGTDGKTYNDTSLFGDDDIYYYKLTFKPGYTVKWVNYDGTVLEEDKGYYWEGQIPEYNGKEPTREADEQNTYYFAGWDKEITEITEDTTYTAKYSTTPVKYTISFDSKGHGKTPESQTHVYGDSISEPKALSEEGYTFGGWYKESDCTNKWDFDEDTVQGDMTLYAKWEEGSTDNENTNNSTVNTVSEKTSAGNDKESEESSSSSGSNPVNPDILMWSYDAASYNSMCIKQEQGSLARLAFNSGMPLGYKEAFTYNLLVNGKTDYSLKTGKFVLTIPEGYRKAGRSFALLGLDQAGKAVCFMDTDLSDSTITTILNLNGYAFMLVYSDGNGTGIVSTSGKTTVSTGTTAQTAGTYTVKSGDTLSTIAEKLKTTVDKLVTLNGIENKDRIKEGQILKY
nr:InlB B-repeat-containing protein [Lachnospiraceae bacterium]